MSRRSDGSQVRFNVIQHRSLQLLRDLCSKVNDQHTIVRLAYLKGELPHDIGLQCGVNQISRHVLFKGNRRLGQSLYALFRAETKKTVRPD